MRKPVHEWQPELPQRAQVGAWIWGRGMSLYYEDEYVELHLGDCRAIRGWTRADVLVTDPPYGTENGNGYGRSGGNGRIGNFYIANDATTEARDEVLEIWGDRPRLVFAARNLGRKAVGVELEEKYCELIVKRLSQQAFDFSALMDGEVSA